MEKIKDRSEVEEQYKWDLTKIYKTEEEFRKDISKALKLIEKVPKHENTMLDSAKDLYDTTTIIMDTSRLIQKIYTYASLKYNENIADTSSIALREDALNLDHKLSEKAAFYGPKLLKCEYETIEKMYDEYPKLREYEIYFKRYFREKAYILDEKSEKLLVSLNKAFSDVESIHSSLTDSDIDFGTIKDEDGKDVILTNTNYRNFIESKNRKVRESAFKQLYGTYARYKTTFTSLLDAHIKQTSTFCKIRGYKSSLYSLMYDDELDEKVFTTLVNSVESGLSPLFKYYKIKKEILGLDELHIYDTYAPIVSKYERKFTYKEAVDIIKDVTSVFGEEYSNIIDKAFKEKWIDLLPNTGKTGGAFSGGCYDTYPYILTNFQGSYNDVSTLIHELGHSVHSYYSRNNNPFVYGNYSIVVAEVASTVNELLFAKYMIKNSKSAEEKLYILDLLMSLFKGTIYRQTMYEEFEKFLFDRVEKEEALTSSILAEKFYELNKKYYGKDVVVDKEIEYEWERMPHLYYDFYMYKYATGLSAACYIVESILFGKENARENYLEFLKQGSRLAPNDELKIAGVDLTDKKVYESAIKMFEDLTEEFEKTYKEYIKK